MAGDKLSLDHDVFKSNLGCLGINAPYLRGWDILTIRHGVIALSKHERLKWERLFPGAVKVLRCVPYQCFSEDHSSRWGATDKRSIPSHLLSPWKPRTFISAWTVSRKKSTSETRYGISAARCCLLKLAIRSRGSSVTGKIYSAPVHYVSATDACIVQTWNFFTDGELITNLTSESVQVDKRDATAR